MTVAGFCLEMNHRTDALAFVHQVKSRIDLFQRHGVGDEGVERDFTGLGFST
jgi:hypothetical protein